MSLALTVPCRNRQRLWPQALPRCLLALALALPGAAYPISLSHLLRLPLDELLRLEIAGPAPAPRLRSDIPMPSPMSAQGHIT